MTFLTLGEDMVYHTLGNAIPVNEVDGEIAIVSSTTFNHLLYLPLLLR